jgi:hypothetical protein
VTADPPTLDDERHRVIRSVSRAGFAPVANVTTTRSALEDIPGPKLREALRGSMRGRRPPLLVIVDAA